MANKNGWRTLGLTTRTRLWVTSDRPSLLGQARRGTSPYSLALAGQTANPLRVATLLASRYGRNFILAKRALLVLFFLLGAELFAQNLLVSSEYLYMWLATVSPHKIFNALLLLCPVLWVVWYKATGAASRHTSWLGPVTLTLTGIFVILFRTLPLEEEAFAAETRAAAAASTGLSRFASVKNPLTWEKKFVVGVYSVVRHLAKFNPNPLSLPEGYVPTCPTRAAQIPGKLNTPLQPFQLRLDRISVIAGWPELLSSLAGQNVKTALHLFQWQSAHAAWGANLKNTKSLWHAHKTPRLNFTTAGIAGVPAGAAKNPKALAPFWTNLVPTKQLTFALQASASTKVRFDLLQPLAPALTRSWGARPRTGRALSRPAV